MALGRQTVALLALAGASFVALAAVAPVQGEPRALGAQRPHNLKLLFNGKRLAMTSLTSSTDNYVSVPDRRLRVEARWTTDARGTGYRVVISTTEPQLRQYASCSTGTSCIVSKRVALLAGQEMSWSVTILKIRGNNLVGGFKVCLIGRA
jgi:hypothetical protein